MSRHVLWTLFGGMALLLVIACANAAALFVARAEHRRREIAVRQALGAHRRHVARMFFTEALVLTTAAAALGLLLAKGLLAGVIAFAPVELPRTAEIALDAVAVAFAAGLAVLMAAFYGVLSVRRQGRSLAVSLLGGGHGRPGSRRSLGARSVSRAAGGAGAHADGGVGADGEDLPQPVAARAGVFRRSDAHGGSGPSFPPGGAARPDLRDVVERVRRLPGVERASAASFVPLTASEDVFPVQGGATPVPFKFFLPGYFQTMETPILDGESFAAGEQRRRRRIPCLSARPWLDVCTPATAQSARPSGG